MCGLPKDVQRMDDASNSVAVDALQSIRSMLVEELLTPRGTPEDIDAQFEKLMKSIESGDGDTREIAKELVSLHRRALLLQLSRSRTLYFVTDLIDATIKTLTE
jgi:hypothetical protein